MKRTNRIIDESKEARIRRRNRVLANIAKEAKENRFKGYAGTAAILTGYVLVPVKPEDIFHLYVESIRDVTDIELDAVQPEPKPVKE